MNNNLKEQILNLRFNENKNYNEIKEQLNCSKGTISYHCNKFTEENEKIINNFNKLRKVEKPIKSKIFKPILKENQKSCGCCKNIKDRTDFYFNKSENRENSYCKQCQINQVNKRQLNLKVEMVKLKGNCCQLCGYNQCLAALEFHHLDRKTKLFTIAKSRKGIMSKELQEELDKCILLCSNCHREIESGFKKL